MRNILTQSLLRGQWLLIAMQSVGSAKEATPKVDSTKVAVDPLAVIATGDPMNRVGQPIFITVNIKNTAGDDLLLENINIKIDGASSDRFTPGSMTCGLQQSGEIRILRGLSFEQSCRFEMKPTAPSWTFKSWQDALLATEVRLAVTAKINGLGEYRYYPSVIVKASELSIFIGGVLGALLLAIFIWIHRMLMDPEVREGMDQKLLFHDVDGASRRHYGDHRPAFGQDDARHRITGLIDCRRLYRGDINRPFLIPARILDLVGSQVG